MLSNVKAEGYACFGFLVYKLGGLGVKQDRVVYALRIPLIGDLFTFAYLSGLLYQVDFLNSEDKGFTSPLYGFGFGLSLFNGLDVSASYAIPTSNAFDNGMFNFTAGSTGVVAL